MPADAVGDGGQVARCELLPGREGLGLIKFASRIGRGTGLSELAAPMFKSWQSRRTALMSRAAMGRQWQSSKGRLFARHATQRFLQLY